MKIWLGLHVALILFFLSTDSIAYKNSDTTTVNRTHTLKQGETLWELGRTYYGNRHYSSIITLHNNIRDVNSIKAGTVIQVPDLYTLMEQEGLCEVAKEDVKFILEARSLFMLHKRSLWELRLGKTGEPVNVPTDVKMDLEHAAELIDKAIVGLREEKIRIIAIPRKMINNLQGISQNLQELAEGANDGFGYDIDMVHQRLVHTLRNGIVWTRNGFE